MRCWIVDVKNWVRLGGVKWPDIDAGGMREYKTLIDKINSTCLENCKNSELQDGEDTWHMCHSGMVVARRLFGKVFDE